MATINGTPDDDRLIGTDAADVVNGLGGNDLVEAVDGDDVVHGNEGEDWLEGGPGDDVLHGDAGNDVLRGSWSFGQAEAEGYDRLFGGDGDDSIVTFNSRAYLVDGGAGVDHWAGSLASILTPITFDTALVASDDGWSLGNDITLRRIEQVRVTLGVGDDRFIQHSGVTSSHVNLGHGADTAHVSVGRTVLTGGVSFDGETDRLLIDYSGAASRLRSDLEDWKTLGEDGSIHKIWEGAEYDSAPRAVSSTGFDIVQIIGSSFADDIIGSDGRDLIFGGDGNDVLTALLGSDLLDGGAGSDTLDLDLRPFAQNGPGPWFRYLLTGATIDLASAEAQALPVQFFVNGPQRFHGRVTLHSVENASGTGLADKLYGDAEANRLVGRAGDDLLSGRNGNDVLLGEGGNDTMVGGLGDDVTDGGAGSDTISFAGAIGRVRVDLSAVESQDTGAGLDKLLRIENAIGGAADDRLQGSDAANRLDGGGGADALLGRGGNDTYVVDDAADRAIEDAAAGGTDTVLSSVDFALAARVENLVLTGTGALAGTGNGSANQITGNKAANVLRGGGGADVVNGAGGSDSIFGGLGRDTLTGGGGEDGFFFDWVLGGSNVDTLGDFRPADDTIMLDRDVFAGIVADGPLAASAFASGTDAQDADDRIVYDRATGRIFYDADGAGGAAAVLFARVTEGTNLSHADFVAYI